MQEKFEWFSWCEKNKLWIKSTIKKEAQNLLARNFFHKDNVQV